MQNRYSLLDRTVEEEVVPACEQFGLGLLPYFPLEYGLLTGKYRRGEAAPAGSRAPRGRTRGSRTPTGTASRASRSTPRQRGVPVLHVAIAGLAAQPGVASVISGATGASRSVPMRRRCGWQPTETDLAELDEVTRGRESLCAPESDF